MNIRILRLLSSKGSVDAAQITFNAVESTTNVTPVFVDGIGKDDIANYTFVASDKFGGSDSVDYRTCKKAEVATFLTHKSVWQECVDLNEPIFVLEDDAHPCKDVSIDLQSYLDIDGDVVDLSSDSWAYDNAAPVRSETTENTIISGHLFGAHAYLVNPSGAQKLLDAAEVEIHPTDHFIRSDICTIYKVNPSPFTFRMKENISDIKFLKEEEQMGAFDPTQFDYSNKSCDCVDECQYAL